jgi:thioredoxin 1
MPIVLNSKNLKEVIRSSSAKGLIVDMHAEWCGPCQMMKPIFAELEKELGTKYNFGSIDVDAETELAEEYEVRSVPTFLFIKNGKVVSKKTGSLSKETLKKLIEETFK